MSTTNGNVKDLATRQPVGTVSSQSKMNAKYEMVASHLLRCCRNKGKPRRKNILNYWLTFSRKVPNAELVLMLRHILDSQWAADLKPDDAGPNCADLKERL